MKIRKGVLIVMLVVVIVVTLASVLATRRVYAQSSKTFAVPKAYGALKGTMGGVLVFEDANGTIRVVSFDSRMGNSVGVVDMTIVRR